MLHRNAVRDYGRRAIALIEDLLLVFILLEVITMVENYWRVGKLPVRIPLYIAMVSMARYLILDTGDAHDIHALYITGAILILALSVFVVRFGHLKFPYGDEDDDA
ncbi:MAG TPA: phosphate-starvation-inducible PsiE family protein, partial [Gammaproteobacteria bacterium]